MQPCKINYSLSYQNFLPGLQHLPFSFITFSRKYFKFLFTSNQSSKISLQNILDAITTVKSSLKSFVAICLISTSTAFHEADMHVRRCQIHICIRVMTRKVSRYNFISVGDCFPLMEKRFGIE